MFLFQINVKNKSKIAEMDKELMNIQDKVMGVEKKVPEEKKQKPVAIKKTTESEYNQMQENSNKTLEGLDSMKL